MSIHSIEQNSFFQKNIYAFLIQLISSLIRNPAIKIIAKRNERECGNPHAGDAPTTSSLKEEASQVPSNLAGIVAAAPPSNQDLRPKKCDSELARNVWSSGNQDSDGRLVFSPSVPSSEEASSRLEALLKSTSASNSCKLPEKTTLFEEPQNTRHDPEAKGKRFRSSIRIMVRPEAVTSLQRPIRANSSDGLSRSSSSNSEAAKSAKKLSAAGVRPPELDLLDQASAGGSSGPQTRPIVKEQFR